MFSNVGKEGLDGIGEKMTEMAECGKAASQDLTTSLANISADLANMTASITYVAMALVVGPAFLAVSLVAGLVGAQAVANEGGVEHLAELIKLLTPLPTIAAIVAIANVLAFKTDPVQYFKQLFWSAGRREMTSRGNSTPCRVSSTTTHIVNSNTTTTT